MYDRKIKCLYWKSGKCNSAYGGRVRKCDGLHPPKVCPYFIYKRKPKKRKKKVLCKNFGKGKGCIYFDVRKQKTILPKNIFCPFIGK